LAAGKHDELRPGRRFGFGSPDERRVESVTDGYAAFRDGAIRRKLIKPRHCERSEAIYVS
jgi:hypothetical protein